MRFDPEHAVEDLPVILRRPARARLLRRQQRGDLLPLRVSQFESLTVTKKKPCRSAARIRPVP
ncbi:hypothetical protein MRA01_53970 [Methylobacterium radiotolerans]|nr:hypothetical protein MRA01_53970 [Methylobacterium radiotolerans]